MATSNALSVAVEMAVRQRDEARRVLQDACSARQAAQDQLNQLEGYARETQNRWGMRPDAVVMPEVMHHHYHFMDRLDHAAGLQTGVVGDQTERVDVAQQALLATELRLASLQKLVEKRHREALQTQARREQKQTDERAAMQLRKTFNGS
ncbi:MULTISPECIES: flagellar export protein FliJ [unclassified Simplicispira]|uniref:flagellar export protein FliJ n=1 Tax=unclassified Simplicispira TaxID=2630407 RepID=UPI000D5ECBAD|nr:MULTISPECIES: flagellar export protein FliJ [unclassified Simplicispira]PVY56958.1 flagellar FliJ protein [Simplicispira sp. 125]REG17903.1 flagellar FliJ protein [Simplicispira sp. 110]